MFCNHSVLVWVATSTVITASSLRAVPVILHLWMAASSLGFGVVPLRGPSSPKAMTALLLGDIG